VEGRQDERGLTRSEDGGFNIPPLASAAFERPVARIVRIGGELEGIDVPELRIG
jgi:hypothetical protein